MSGNKVVSGLSKERSQDVPPSKSTSSAQIEYAQYVNDVRQMNNGLRNAKIDLCVSNLIIVTKLNDIFLYFLTRELVEWLLANFPGVTVYVESVLRDDPKFGAADVCHDCHCSDDRIKYWTPEFVRDNDMFFDMAITMGGDGTVLYVSTLFQKHVPPVLAFSLGSLGFLTNFQFANFRDDLPRILNSKIKSNLRMRLQGTVYKGGQPVATHQVLNEITIDRGPGPFISNLEIFGDDYYMTTAQGDGLIIATPTGSTAYSLSAGGSLVCPTVNAIGITPICPHTLSFRPIILPDSITLKIKVAAAARGPAWASFDGKNRTELKQGEYLEICCSSYSFPTVDSTDEEFIRNISRTLNWNVREQQKSFGSVLSSKNKENFARERERSRNCSRVSLGGGSPRDSDSEVDVSDSSSVTPSIDFAHALQRGPRPQQR